ncbi:hypothetical protein B0H17DRAFT_1145534 [Mycena rosella]|uniref:Uncharacterized protein n=1 Tax=Mycena rosella TaxID=1033263 RepID=A0AAD7CQV5_MYCRO|nr:hypothetical protein B0H17DRAFT_1145534 [Mycena rosella]
MAAWRNGIASDYDRLRLKGSSLGMVKFRVLLLTVRCDANISCTLILPRLQWPDSLSIRRAPQSGSIPRSPVAQRGIPDPDPDRRGDSVLEARSSSCAAVVGSRAYLICSNVGLGLGRNMPGIDIGTRVPGTDSVMLYVPGNAWGGWVAEWEVGGRDSAAGVWARRRPALERMHASQVPDTGIDKVLLEGEEGPGQRRGVKQGRGARRFEGRTLGRTGPVGARGTSTSPRKEQARVDAGLCGAGWMDHASGRASSRSAESARE